MRYAIFSDIHGNLEALQAVLLAYQADKIDKYICLGDIVGYGADPRKCIARLSELGSVNLAGNHDWAVVDKFDSSFFNSNALEAILWTMKQVNAREKQFLKNLALTYSDRYISCAHGTLFRPEKFSYMYSLSVAADSFRCIEKKICFIGHTHIPMFFKQSGGQIKAYAGKSVRLEDDAEYIFNIGSVGQPRDGIPEAAYGIYDTKKRLVEIKRISYNISKAQSKIRKAGIAEYLAQRLGQGR
ncbi:MAG: metallophosphoesterase family protein [Candidatus Omnitrophota bacterium]